MSIKEPTLEKNIENENLETSTNSNSIENNLYEIKPNKNKSDVLAIFWILVLILITLILIACITFTFININQKTIFSGISVKGIDISNLTVNEAINKIQNSIQENIPEEIKLVHNDYEASIPSSELEISFDIASAVNSAYKIGRTGNALENNIAVLKAKLSKINLEPTFSINEEQLKTYLEDISTKLPDAVVESSYYIDDTNLILTKGKTGSIINIEDSISHIKEEIKNLNIKDNYITLITEEKSPTPLDVDAIHTEIYKEPQDAYYTQNPYSVYPSENGVDFSISVEEAKLMLSEEKDEYTIPLKILYPNVTTNMIGTEAFPDLLSDYSTKYAVSNKNRTTNLILAANKINGTVLMPGETFSYNKVVGERTIAAGYKEAPIYVNGEVVDGLGGGICQITTTLYNAVVYANLEIVERSNHQFVPSYVTASRDATVVYGSIDFKFKNTRDYPIKLVCSVANGIANFKVFGLKQENEYQVEIYSRVTGTTSNAIYSEAYKILKQNGQTISQTLLSKDTYKRH